MKDLSTATTRRVSVIFASVFFIFLLVSAFLKGMYHFSQFVLRLVFNLFLLRFDLLYFYDASLSLSLSLCFLLFCLLLSVYFICSSIIVFLCLFLLRIETKILFLFYYFFTTFSSLHDCRSGYYALKSTDFPSVRFEQLNSRPSSEASPH